MNTENEFNNIKYIGWLYCIKSNETDIYKCGYTTQLTKEKCESHLRSRYGIIVTNPIIIHLVNVSKAKMAETQLFNKLKHYKHVREMYKTKDINVIISAMNDVALDFRINEELIEQINQYNIYLKNKKLDYCKNNIKIIEYKCSTCDNTFSSKQYLKTHITKCSGKKNPLICQYCNRIFNFSTNKYNHLKVCKVKKEQECKELIVTV